MKFRFSRSTGAVAQLAKRRRRGLFAAPRAFDTDRPVRVYSLLLPPNATSTRR